MKYLLDTDTVSYALRGVGRVAAKLERTQPGDLAVSSVTESELWYGVEKRGSKKLRALVSAFLQPIEIVPFDSAAARWYGAIQVRLERAGSPIGLADAMTAAIGLTRKLTLVTHNTKHFKRIKGLRTVDWV